ncbi:MAG TPA: hypothetical protein VGM88_24895 [Kofleriaceae bacterium]
MPDAMIDAGSDGPTIDSMCGTKKLLTGELVDWDSTNGADDFCGVFGATFTVHGTPSETAMTAPNGRYLLCADDAPQIRVDITMPTDPSPCAAAPGTYMIPGIAYFPQAVVADGAMFSARAITAERAAVFFSEMEGGFGVTYDPTKPQLFVHVNGGSALVDTDADHDTALTFNGTIWSGGNTGTDLYFPNLSSTQVQLGSSPVADGDAAYIMEPGVFTYITISL